MSCFLSNEPVMYEAYTTGKDLYAMIAQSAFDNNYEDNLEFWVPGTELEIDGKKIVSGSGKETLVKTDSDDSISIKYYEILETTNGDKTAKDIAVNDIVLSDIGNLVVVNKHEKDSNVVLTFCKQ